jgi:hypothetical protein
LGTKGHLTEVKELVVRDLKAKSSQVTKDKEGQAAILIKVVEDLTKVEMALMTSMAAI